MLTIVFLSSQQAELVPGGVCVIRGRGEHRVCALFLCARVDGRLTYCGVLFSDYWGYFQPILEYMPKNCSADVQAVIAHIDSVFTSGNHREINTILKLFNMTELSNHLDDAAGAREYFWHALPASGLIAEPDDRSPQQPLGLAVPFSLFWGWHLLRVLRCPRSKERR